MRPGRLASVAMLGALLAGGLAACRADPSVAAYVDQEQVTVAEVDEVVDGLREIVPPEQLAAVRSNVLQLRVLTVAARDYAEAEQVTVPAADPAQHAAQIGLAADHPYVEVYAAYFAVMSTLREHLEPVAPDEADQREIYDNLRDAGAGDLPPFPEAQQVLTIESVGQPVAERDLYREILDAADITVNPRYELVYRIPVPLGGAGESWLSVQVGDQAVVEIR